MKRFALLLVSVAFLSLLSSNAKAQEVAARASADSTKFLLGDAIHVRLDVEHPVNTSLQPLIGDTLGRFFILDRSSFEKKSETASTMSLTVANYDSGTGILPEIEIAYQIPGDSATHSIKTNPLLFSIRPLAVDTSAAIKDIKPPLSVSYTLLEILIFIGIILAVLVIGYLLYRYWKKRKARQRGEIPTLPTRPAHVIAIEELNNLESKKLWQNGRVKEYYTEVTEILRRYFEGRFEILALEQTTDEIMRDLKLVSAPKIVQDITERILRRGDLVKFAKHQPGVQEHEDMIIVAYEVVDKTRPTEMKPVTQSELVVEAHVGT